MAPTRRGRSLATIPPLRGNTFLKTAHTHRWLEIGIKGAHPDVPISIKRPYSSSHLALTAHLDNRLIWVYSGSHLLKKGRHSTWGTRKMALSFASRLSPSTLFLFAPSPPRLPRVPTLEELQRHAAEIQKSIIDSVPAYTAKEASQPVSIGIGAAQDRSAGRMITGETPPPGYEERDPCAGTTKEGRVECKKLQKFKG